MRVKVIVIFLSITLSGPPLFSMQRISNPLYNLSTLHQDVRRFEAAAPEERYELLRAAIMRNDDRLIDELLSRVERQTHSIPLRGNAPEHRVTLLMEAIRACNISVIDRLCRAGADPYARDIIGLNAFSLAISTQNIDVLAKLYQLHPGFISDRRYHPSRTPLGDAVFHGYERSCAFLLKHGASTHGSAYEGKTIDEILNNARRELADQYSTIFGVEGENIHAKLMLYGRITTLVVQARTGASCPRQTGIREYDDMTPEETLAFHRRLHAYREARQLPSLVEQPVASHVSAVPERPVISNRQRIPLSIFMSEEERTRLLSAATAAHVAECQSRPAREQIFEPDHRESSAETEGARSARLEMAGQRLRGFSRLRTEQRSQEHARRLIERNTDIAFLLGRCSQEAQDTFYEMIQHPVQRGEPVVVAEYISGSSIIAREHPDQENNSTPHGPAFLTTCMINAVKQHNLSLLAWALEQGAWPLACLPDGSGRHVLDEARRLHTEDPDNHLYARTYAIMQAAVDYGSVVGGIRPGFMVRCVQRGLLENI